jgi:hypothetical protein
MPADDAQRSRATSVAATQVAAQPAAEEEAADESLSTPESDQTTLAAEKPQSEKDEAGFNITLWLVLGIAGTLVSALALVYTWRKQP